MHPITKDFIETATPLHEIFDKHKEYDEGSSILHLLAHPLRNFNETLTDKAKKQISKVNFFSLEPEIQFLFLRLFSQHSARGTRSKFESSFYKKYYENLSNDLPPVFKIGYYFTTHCQLENYTLTANESFKILKRSYDTSPRFSHWLSVFTTFKSQIGHLYPVESEIIKIRGEENVEDNISSLANGFEINPLKNRSSEIKRVFTKYHIDPMKNDFDIVDRLSLSEYLSGEKELTDKNLEENALLFAKPLIQANLYLGENDISSAMKLSRQANDIRITSRLLEHTPIRLAIASGDTKTAKHLLSKVVCPNIMQGFYMAQICLFENNIKLAKQYMVEQNKLCEEYQCHHLLDLEFKWAPQLTMSQIRLLIKAESGAHIKEFPTLDKIKTDSDTTLSIKGNSKPIKELLLNIKKVSKASTSILISGETGTGKELIANSIHHQSKRAKQPFIAINCASILGSILQSELFGYQAGAFTGAQKNHVGIFEAAKSGTVFLDEIGEINQETQVALLRVLESNEIRPVGSNTTKKIKCQIISATNANLEKMIDEGTFRKDLYFRLNRIKLSTPPLKALAEDIIFLAEYFLNHSIPNNGQKIILSDELKKVFLNYSWPGNVRELKNMMESFRCYYPGKLIYDNDDAAPFIKEDKMPHEKVSTQGTQIAPKEERPVLFPFDHKSQYRRIEELRRLFREHKRFSGKEASILLGVTPKTISNDFKILIKEGFLQKIEPSKSPRTHYFIINENNPTQRLSNP